MIALDVEVSEVRSGQGKLDPESAAVNCSCKRGRRASAGNEREAFS